MLIELNNKDPEHDRLAKMKKWTIDDYYFYMDFLNDLFPDDANIALSEEEKAYLESAYQRFMKRINAK